MKITIKIVEGGQADTYTFEDASNVDLFRVLKPQIENVMDKSEPKSTLDTASESFQFSFDCHKEMHHTKDTIRSTPLINEN